MWGLPPALDMDYEKRVQTAIREIVAAAWPNRRTIWATAVLAVALAECCFGRHWRGSSSTADLRPEFLLFHEGPSRILVSTEPEEVMKIASKYGVEAPRIGVTMKEWLRIEQSRYSRCDAAVARLRELVGLRTRDVCCMPD